MTSWISSTARTFLDLDFHYCLKFVQLQFFFSIWTFLDCTKAAINVLPVCKNTKVKKATTVYTTSSGTETVVSGRDLPRGSVRMPIPAVPYSLLAHPHFRFLWNTTKIINKHYFQPHFYSHTLQHWQNNQYLINQSHPISCCKLSTNNSVLLCVYCGSS